MVESLFSEVKLSVSTFLEQLFSKCCKKKSSNWKLCVKPKRYRKGGADIKVCRRGEKEIEATTDRYITLNIWSPFLLKPSAPLPEKVRLSWVMTTNCCLKCDLKMKPDYCTHIYDPGVVCRIKTNAPLSVTVLKITGYHFIDVKSPNLSCSAFPHRA